jgi:hypothetical protein
MTRWIALAGSCFTLLAASCGAGAAGAQEITWTPFQGAQGVVDLAGPRSDGRLVVAMGGGVQLFGGSGLRPFTSPTGDGAYVPSANEPYIALTPKVRLPKAHCSFHRDEVFAIGENPNRVVRITRAGRASDFVVLPSPFLGAITFDRVGTFGHRLLVSGTEVGQSTLYAIDCRGRVRTLMDHGPNVEGGIEVAPRGFGRFGGRLIGLDEMHGPIYAFKPNGSVTTLATPSLPTGADIGVESLGFVPRLKPNGAAFLADHGVPGAPHPGTDSLLRLTAAQLKSAGVGAGDLLVATEGGAETVVVRCRRRKPCSVRRIGQGPSVAHAEGHIAFLGVRRPG